MDAKTALIVCEVVGNCAIKDPKTKEFLSNAMKAFGVAEMADFGIKTNHFFQCLQTLQTQCKNGNVEAAVGGLKSLSEHTVFQEACNGKRFEELKKLGSNPTAFLKSHGGKSAEKALSKLNEYATKKVINAELVNTGFALLHGGYLLYLIYDACKTTTELNIGLAIIEVKIKSFREKVDAFIAKVGKQLGDTKQSVNFNDDSSTILHSEGLQLKSIYNAILEEICKLRVKANGVLVTLKDIKKTASTNAIQATQCVTRNAIAHCTTDGLTKSKAGIALLGLSFVVGAAALAGSLWSGTQAGKKQLEIEKLLSKLSENESKLGVAYAGLRQAMLRLDPRFV